MLRNRLFPLIGEPEVNLLLKIDAIIVKADKESVIRKGKETVFSPVILFVRKMYAWLGAIKSTMATKTIPVKKETCLSHSKRLWQSKS
jgi:hypothetical protein